jgi:hypothetical protein
VRGYAADADTAVAEYAAMSNPGPDEEGFVAESISDFKRDCLREFACPAFPYDPGISLDAEDHQEKPKFFQDAFAKLKQACGRK